MTTFATDSAWQPVNIGAGGYVTGIDVAPDGTMVARTDTYGAYLWNGTEWTQLVTSNSMPSNVLFSYGVYEIRVSASNSNVMYMEMASGIYKTIDRGQHWTKTSFPALTIDPNGNNRMDGQKMAIDPNNSNIVFAGTQHDGLWVTRDGGTTWQKIAVVPQGPSTDDPALTGIVIQGSNVFVGTAGSGVYASHDGGVTWSAIGGPADVFFAVSSPDGSYWAADETGLWKYANGGWVKSLNTNDQGVHTVAIDPFNALHIMVTNEGGGLQESNDGGVTWSGQNWYQQLESSDDVPWLETTSRYMGSGGMIFDPLVPGKLWQSAGVGVWTMDVPAGFTWQTPVTWHSQSEGIEQLVANDIIAPAGGNPVFGSWDRAFFEMPDVDAYATNYSGGAFSMGWSLDYASSSPQFVVGISNWWGTENSGFSTDGGNTWQQFAGYPSFAGQAIGGSIAASSPTNIIWAPANGYAPAYTLDGGATWQTINIPGKTDWSDFHFAYYLGRTTITADRVLPHTFYLYDSASGVYRTSDGGVTWDKVFTGEISIFSYSNAKIEAVPGSAGELYFTGGPQGSDGSVVPGLLNFMHSSDGGASWQAVTGVQAITFGYGASATPGGPATVYVVGTVNGTYGVWYSADDAQTWTQIGEHPMGSLDTIRTISGDMDQFGLVYVGFGGSGYAYLSIDGLADTQPLPQPTTPPPDQEVIPSDAIDDFNGDGRSDILWRNDDGTLSIWLGQANGGFIPNNIEVASLVPTAGRSEAASLVPTAGRVAGTGDFNGDGRTDILWRNDDGTLSNWLGQVGGGFVANKAIGAAAVPTAWQVVGTGDFNGDGRDDILWRNENGELSNWLGTATGGFTPNNANAASTVSTAWTVVGTGDFNGDGRDDILWRNDNGELSNWLGRANGGFEANNRNAATIVTTDWHVVGTGDFNGDGRDDILWRNADGQLSNWLGQANGGFVANDANAALLVPTAWTVVATGDYNGDGRDDILWRHTDGTLSNWLGTTAGGFTPNDANAATAVAISWNVQPADMWI